MNWQANQSDFRMDISHMLDSLRMKHPLTWSGGRALRHLLSHQLTHVSPAVASCVQSSGTNQTICPFPKSNQQLISSSLHML